jgi:riboflavin biosynthesis pyrimidine reductase
MPDAARRNDAPADPYSDLVIGDRRPAGATRPWVAICAVASADGVVAVDGSSRGIGGPADLRALQRIRRGVDAVLVGAATVRAEGYDAALTRAEDAGWRRERGLTDIAVLVIVSRSLELGSFGSNVRDTRVILLTEGAREAPEALTSRLAANGSTLELIDCADDGAFAWSVALERLLASGIQRISCEGGPSINAQLVTHGLVDECFLTIAPRLLGARGRTATTVGFAGDAISPGTMRLQSVAAVGDELLVRYDLSRDR